MKIKRVISPKNLPVMAPLSTTLAAIVCVDYYGVALVWRGVFYTILGLWWLAWVISIFTSEHVELFKEG